MEDKRLFTNKQDIHEYYIHLKTSDCSAAELELQHTVISEDVNAVSKCKISNQHFIKPTIPKLNCPTNLSSTVIRLSTGYFKGMKLSPDNSRSYPICRNCPQTQSTPDHIFDYKTTLASFFQLDASPQDILCSPQATDLASLVIGLLDQYRNALNP
ncbi:hypothetical protein TNCV_524391 [Trichonephila clavipes]|nr:hypothetical protein TNCV_524391 [Trichonephila clavipes]